VSALVAQTGLEVRLLVRRAEALLITLAIPAGMLAFFSGVANLPIPARYDEPVDFLLPGSLALAVIATSMVALGISTGYDRAYGVLKRLGGSPLGRPRLLAAKAISVLVFEALQIAVLVGLGLALGWDGGGANIPAATLSILLGSAAFAGIALLCAGALRAEATLAITNGLFGIFLFLGDAIYSLDRLPEALTAVGRALPAAAFADTLRAALTEGADLPAGSFGLLVAWAVATLGAAAWAFRWE